MQEMKKVIDKIEQMFYSMSRQNICSARKGDVSWRERTN